MARVGGHSACVYETFGAYAVMVIAERPDHVSAAALAMAVTASGAAKVLKTTPLLTIEAGIKAMRKASGTGYRPPGSERCGSVPHDMRVGGALLPHMVSITGVCAKYPRESLPCGASPCIMLQICTGLRA
jgi:hypothetical protein